MNSLRRRAPPHDLPTPIAEDRHGSNAQRSLHPGNSCYEFRGRFRAIVAGRRRRGLRKGGILARSVRSAVRSVDGGVSQWLTGRNTSYIAELKSGLAEGKIGRRDFLRQRHLAWALSRGRLRLCEQAGRPAHGARGAGSHAQGWNAQARHAAHRHFQSAHLQLGMGQQHRPPGHRLSDPLPGRTTSPAPVCWNPGNQAPDLQTWTLHLRRDREVAYWTTVSGRRCDLEPKAGARSRNRFLGSRSDDRLYDERCWYGLVGCERHRKARRLHRSSQLQGAVSLPCPSISSTTRS